MSERKINIMLADDDLDDCGFFKKALDALPLSTNLTIANDGEQLMKMLTEKDYELPDILFLDLNMPRKNGMECLTEIRQNAKLKGLSIVIFSTSNNDALMRKLFKEGVHLYIHKPGDFKQLKEVIHNAIPIASEKVFSTSRVNYILNA
jgi:CheY-like chemotaxis protein